MAPGVWVFTEHVAAEGELLLRLPGTMTFENVVTCNWVGHGALCIPQELGLTGSIYGGCHVFLGPYLEAVVGTRPLRVVHSFCMGLTLSGRSVDLYGMYGRLDRPQERDMARSKYPQVQRLLDKGLVTTLPFPVMRDSWEGVIRGMGGCA